MEKTNDDAMFSDWGRKAHTKTQLYIKQIWKPPFGCFLGNRWSTDRFWPRPQKQFSLRTVSGLFWHVRLIVFCSQGQEGTMLAATRATVSDGMCCTSYLTLVWALSREETLPRDRRATSGHDPDGQLGKWFPAKTLNVHMLATKQEHNSLHTVPCVS